MGKYLSMSQKETIVRLHETMHWSKRKIALQTGISRNTVKECLKKRQSELTHPTAGNPTTESPQSKCEPHRELIQKKLDDGQIGMSIYYDLQQIKFSGSYESVKRFIRQLKKGHPEWVGRILTRPGEEAQVDFGLGAPTRHPKTGQYRRPYLFVMTLSHSGKHYSEVVWRQTQEEWVRCHQRAFEFFGGVPATVVLDNLKAGVEKADYYDPKINRLYAEFSHHMGFEVLPCRVREPRHKGKVERIIQYVQDVLKGRRFESLDEQNEFLRHWEESTARWRIHGRTKKQVQALFEKEDRPALRPLPAEPFEIFQFGFYRVGRDGLVDVRRAYYAVPGFLGRQVEVRWTLKLVRIYDPAGKLLVTHLRKSEGSVSTYIGMSPSQKPYDRIEYEKFLLEKIGRLGNEPLSWAREAMRARGVMSLRLWHGLLQLADQHGSDRIRAACRHALNVRAFRYHILKEFCEGSPQPLLPAFSNQDDVMRPLSDYSNAAEQSSGGTSDEPT